MKTTISQPSNNSLKVLDGTSPIEVFSLTFFIPLCSLLIWLITGNTKYLPRTIQLLEVLLLNSVLLLALTLLQSHLQIVLLFLVLSNLIMLYILVMRNCSNPDIKYMLKDAKLETSKKNLNRDFIGAYRGHLLLATCICILAVDFNSFPGRFAKTETYGWSTMDAGVGSFALMHGLCSSHGKNLSAKHDGLKKKSFLSSLPLFLLGILRFAAVTIVGYHKVVSEYGVHWNFFLTLAFTKMACSIILCKSSLSPGILAIVTVIIHQILLSKVGLASLILSDDRTTFIKANKEGICSLLGFISLYFCGVQIGRIVWKQGNKMKDYFYMLLTLCSIGLIGWLLMYTFHEAIQPVSRRMANLPYCVWVVSLTSLQLAVHLCQELVMLYLCKLLKNHYSDFLLWKAINYNGLFYFLLANLLTGLVNLSLNLEKMSNFTSLLILFSYLGILSGSVVVLYKKQYQPKFL